MTKDQVNTVIFIEFLKWLVYKADRPIYLIVDGHPTHKAKIVREYLESTNGIGVCLDYIVSGAFDSWWSCLNIN